MRKPDIGSLWMHKESSTTYKVLLLTNLASAHDDYPLTVVYQEIREGVSGHLDPWSKPLTGWYERMEEIV